MGLRLGPVFPNGPMRPSDGVQRGSVEDLRQRGRRSADDRHRRGARRAAYADRRVADPHEDSGAADLVRRRAAAAGGDRRTDGARGLARARCRSPTGSARARRRCTSRSRSTGTRSRCTTSSRRSRDRRFPDEWIIRGNHHDAWVNGANDPVSGMAPELEEARALGELRKQGWSPKRTIVYASWDGEEPGLLGSTEWVETHAEGPEGARRRVHQHRRQRPRVPQRERIAFARTVRQRRRARRHRSRDGHQRLEAAAGARSSPEARPTNERSARERPDLRIDALGSGSDYTPFLQHAGIASINISFGDEDEDGIYHSIYDDFYFYTRFLDTDFAYGRALAQTVGTAVIRLADARRRAVRVHQSRRHGAEIRARAEGAAEPEAGRHPRTEPADRRRRLRGDARSEDADAGADRSRSCRRRSTSRRSTTPPRRWPTAPAATNARSPSSRIDGRRPTPRALRALNARLRQRRDRSSWTMRACPAAPGIGT